MRTAGAARVCDAESGGICARKIAMLAVLGQQLVRASPSDRTTAFRQHPQSRLKLPPRANFRQDGRQKLADEAAKLPRSLAEQAASSRWSPAMSALSSSGSPSDAGLSDQMVPRVGFEPTTYRLRSGCSTAELSGRRKRLANSRGRSRAGLLACYRATAKSLHAVNLPSM